MKYLYTIQGYSKMKMNGDLTDVTNLSIKASNEKEAMDKAKEMVSKTNYRVSRVIEVGEEVKVE